jgi:hypothetical protein
MGEKDFSTKLQGIDPKTVEKVRDRLEVLAAFAYLGQRAYMEGGYTAEGWEEYLRSIETPWDEEHMREVAFGELLKIASATWMMLLDPEQVIEGPQAGGQEGGE